MGREMFEPVITIATAIVGLAIIAVLVSQKSNTSGVFAAAGGAFSNAVSAAVSPVTGNSAAPNVNAGASSMGFNAGAGGNLFSGLNLSSSIFG